MKIPWKIISLICLVNLFLISCAHQIEIKDQNIQASKMKAGQSYIAPIDGWFISDESTAKMLYAIQYYQNLWMECESKK